MTLESNGIESNKKSDIIKRFDATVSINRALLHVNCNRGTLNNRIKFTFAICFID